MRSLFALALLQACTPDTEEQPAPEEVVAPDEVGPYGVVTIESEVVGTEEDLPIQIWYPSDDADGVAYSYGGLLAATAVTTGTPACESPRPVIVFSHGNGGIRYQSATTMEYFASHGWIVAAPDHVRNTFFDADDDYYAAMFLRRPLDIAATFDGLLEEDSLAGCIDPEAGYVVMGHSFGGYTAYATGGAPMDVSLALSYCEGDDSEGCQKVVDWADAHPDEDAADLSDPRVWGVVVWAPAFHEIFGDRMSEISVPTLVVGGEEDDMTTWAGSVEASYQELTTETRALAGISGAGHYSFTDVCPFLGETSDGCEPSAAPIEEVHATVNTLVTAWLRTENGENGLEEWLPPEEGISHWERGE